MDSKVTEMGRIWKSLSNLKKNEVGVPEWVPSNKIIIIIIKNEIAGCKLLDLKT